MQSTPRGGVTMLTRLPGRHWLTPRWPDESRNNFSVCSEKYPGLGTMSHGRGTHGAPSGAPPPWDRASPRICTLHLPCASKVVSFQLTLWGKPIPLIWKSSRVQRPNFWTPGSFRENPNVQMYLILPNQLPATDLEQGSVLP